MQSSVTKCAPWVAAVLASTVLLAGCGAGGSSEDGSESLATLKVLYRADSPRAIRVFGALKEQLAAVDIEARGIPASDTAYAQTLQDPSRQRSWDLAIASRAAQAAGDDAASLLRPLVDGTAAFPPVGNNFGRYDDAATGDLVAAARTSGSLEAWKRVDDKVIEDAVVYPVAEPLQPNYSARTVGRLQYVPAFQNYDPANVTKSSAPGRKPVAADRTLFLRGTGSTADPLDPNLSYYSVNYLALSLWSRQLYAFPTAAAPGVALRPRADLAAADPVVTALTLPDGTQGSRVVVPFRTGVTWSNGRRVSPQDVVLGLKRTCNPVHPFGGLDQYRDLVVGLAAYCEEFASVAPEDRDGINAMLAKPVAGVSATASAVVLQLTEPGVTVPAARALLTSPAFAAAPVEFLRDLPGSLTQANMLSNGPYKIDSYAANGSIVLSQNPFWTPLTDPGRLQRFARIQVVLGDSPDETQTRLEASTRADLQWDNFVPPGKVASLSGDRRLDLNPTYAIDPYLVFNTASPFRGGLLAQVPFRQALSTAIDRDVLIAALGGPTLNAPSTRMLPPSIRGQQAPDRYPFDAEKARRDLAALLG